MTRSQMIETVARKTGLTEAQVETTMDALFDQSADCLRADEKEMCIRDSPSGLYHGRHRRRHLRDPQEAD